MVVKDNVVKNELMMSLIRFSCNFNLTIKFAILKRIAFLHEHNYKNKRDI